MALARDEKVLKSLNKDSSGNASPVVSHQTGFVPALAETLLTSSFRTADDQVRTERAAAVVARAQAAVDASRTASTAADAACVESGDDNAFEIASSARRALADAEGRLALSKEHAARVEGEVAAAERAAIEKAIAQRESSLTEIVDDEALEGAVEISLLSFALCQRHQDRVGQRRSEFAELNELRRKIGLAPEDAAALERVLNDSATRLVEIAQLAQEKIDSRAAPQWGSMWPMWEPASGFEKYVAMGKDRTALVRAAAAALERVQARRVSSEPGKSTVPNAVKLGAVIGLGVISALGIMIE